MSYIGGVSWFSQREYSIYSRMAVHTQKHAFSFTYIHTNMRVSQQGWIVHFIPAVEDFGFSSHACLKVAN